jgi:thiol-disulfide isomerase/thioredoxin
MAALPPATLEVYYAPSCAPCRLELPVLASFAKTRDGHLRIVLVSDVARARADLKELAPALAAMAMPAANRDARASLRVAGDADGILPFARSVAANGGICASWRGVLTEMRINNLLIACARFNAPHSPRP